jgi:hypothetical protein
MWSALVRHVFRLHRGVAHRPAEAGCLHVVDASVRSNGDDQDVDEGQRKSRDDDGALARIPQIKDRPVGYHTRRLLPRPPHTDWNEQQPGNKRGGNRDEQHQPDVRIVEISEQVYRIAGGRWESKRCPHARGAATLLL